MNNTPYIVTFHEAQKNKKSKKAIKVIFEEKYIISSTGYVYEWTFEHEGDTWYYLGYHSIKINEGKLYDFSSQVPKMRELYINEKCQKTLKIKHWGTAEQMKKKEEELLVEIKKQGRFWNNGKGDYFNQKIQHISGNQISGLDYDNCDKAINDLKILKDPNNKHRYNELEILSPNLIQKMSAKELAEMPNLQVRDQALINELTTTLQFQIQTQITDGKDIYEGAKAVVVLEDRDWNIKGEETHWDYVLIAGKHTSNAYGSGDTKWRDYAELDVILIPKSIHQKWNDMELWEMALRDNDKTEISVSNTKDCFVRKYRKLEDNNILWNTVTEQNRVKEALKSATAWKYIKDQMEDYINDKTRISQGKGPRISWGTTSNPHTILQREKCVKLNGGTDDELIANFIENGITPKDVYHKGPITCEVVNPYTQIFGPLNTKIIKYCTKNNISDKKQKQYIEEFQNSIKEVKYYLYYPTLAAKEKFAKDNSHKTQIFGDGAHFLFHDYDYKILQEYEKGITT